jgi:glycosyltransferase involved in cell wall biosynthesis
MEPRRRVFILYLGRRGGGARFTLQVAQEICLIETLPLQSLIVRRDYENKSDFDQSKLKYLFDSGVSFKSIIKVMTFILKPKRLLNELRISRGDICIVPMISPLGLMIESVLSREGVRVIRFIHDAKKHPGDIWPTNFIISRVIRSTKSIIVLSNNVANQIAKKSPKTNIVVFSHPVFRFPETRYRLDLPQKYILFIGRVRRYKGLTILIDAFNILSRNDVKLVIAGEGTISSVLNKNCFLINRWLGEEEISELIRRAEIVCFPYIESSQSGLLPYCMAMNKKIVISPSEGLIEQLQDYKNGLISRDYTSQELSLALLKGIELEPKQSKIIQEHTDLLEKCILQSLNSYE